MLGRSQVSHVGTKPECALQFAQLAGCHLLLLIQRLNPSVLGSGRENLG
jgi:hypothetical protein